jgi:hypothetical protein
MKLTKKKIEELIKDYGVEFSSKLGLSAEDSILVLKKALEGGETAIDKIEDWVNNRFIPNCVEINRDEYALMCVNALKSVFNVAATDYGSSRQRDLGHIWGNTISGYLGELAFVKFLKNNWGVVADIGHEKGKLAEYLPMDIHKVKLPNEPIREPNIKISIKTSKWRGIWLDIPGDQFNHSDIHVFVKIGVGTDHLFAFFKEISVFRDKVLKIGEEVGSLTKTQSEDLFESLPTFSPIKAYICGFAPKNKEYKSLSYSGKKGTKNFEISGWNGPLSQARDLDKIKEIEKLPGKASFLGIGRFNHDQGYVFNTGNLIWSKANWDSIISKI